MILLNAEILELESEPDAPLEAVVIESKVDPRRGPVASIIVRKGTLNFGDTIYAGQIAGKVKNMVDHTGTQIKTAGPSTPVEILGFEKAPAVGAVITTQKQEETRDVVDKKPLAQYTINGEDAKRLPIIVKADVEGTLEALLGTFSDDVEVIFSAVGPVTDNDVFMAQTANAQIFAFNVSTPAFIKKLAENSKVKIFESRIIYEIIDEIQNQVLHILEPTIDETILGEGTIIAEFKIEKVRIAGIKVTKGVISKADSIHLKRDGKIIKDTKVEGIHQAKNVLDSIKATAECGMTFRPYVDFKINDDIIAYKN